MRKPLCLVGMMGCGKSSVGVLLAKRLALPFYDSDSEIEKQSKKTIPELFQESGEQGFRLLEKKVILGLLEGAEGVLSIGGGAFVQDSVRAILLEQMDCIYLKTKPETLYERVKGYTNRPLLQNQNPLGTLKKLLSERECFYQQSSRTIETDGKDIDRIVQEILEQLDFNVV